MFFFVIFSHHPTLLILFLLFSLFGSAFERTAEKSKSLMLPDYADSSRKFLLILYLGQFILTRSLLSVYFVYCKKISLMFCSFCYITKIKDFKIIIIIIVEYKHEDWLDVITHLHPCHFSHARFHQSNLN